MSKRTLGTVLAWLLFAWMVVVLWAAFMWAPAAEGFGQSSRIVFFHVPAAWVATMAFIWSGLASVLYLIRYKPEHDIRAMVAAELGLVFALLATVTGSIFAKIMWHSYWNWDPRQTSITILLLIYAAYFALRASVEDPEKRSTLAAVYAILACATVPFLIFVVPRVYESLHPDTLISRQGDITPGGMDPRILAVLLGSVTGFSAFAYWLYSIQCRIERIRLRREHELL